MNPKVSIIIATFNADKTLSVALDSVLYQLYQAWECIVIDGDSKDTTIDIIKQYQAKDARFRFISEPDNGIYDAMNKGWKMAKGEWILYLGADDILTQDGIATLINETFENDIVYGNTILKYKNTKIKKQISDNVNKITRRSFACHQSILVLKQVFYCLNGFDLKYKIISDYDFMLRAYLHGFKFHKIDSFISEFYTGGISQNNIKVVFERFKIHKIHKIKYKYLFFIKSYIKYVLLQIKYFFN